MKSLKSLRLGVWAIAGVVSVLSVQPGWAEVQSSLTLPEQTTVDAQVVDDQTEIPQIDDLPKSATTVQEWIAQVEAATVQVTGVTLNRTEAGLEIVLDTPEGKPLAIDATKFRAEGISLIADIPNAVLALPEGQAFTAESPTEEIATVRVVQQDASSIWVSVTGKDALPKQEVTLKTGAFTYTLNPEDEAAEEELVVTGENEGRYFIPDTSTATKTDTPIRDIPASIQIVPQQVLKDRNVRTVTEALETVSGVVPGNRPYGGTPLTLKIIRGFDQAGTGVVNFRNGFPDGDFYTVTPPATIEQVEVLKGPASVLFGAGEPGGIVNVVTKQPLSEPFYQLAFEVGNFGLYQPSLDVSGPLNADKTVLYRFIASYQGSSDFQGFAERGLTTIAPSISLKLGERTNLDLYYEFSRISGYPASGLTNAVFLSDGSLTPRDFATYYPSLSQIDFSTQKFGYIFSHKFSNNWQLRNNLAIVLSRFAENVATGFTVVDDQFLEGFDTSRAVFVRNNYFGQIDLLGKFKTGALDHQFLVGLDINRNTNASDNGLNADTPLPPLDIRNPNYDIPTPTYSTRGTFSIFDFVRQSYGIYIQDQITFNDNLKFLIGGRYDWTTTEFAADTVTGGDVIRFPTRNDGAFSPRVGLVYQPSKEVSLYASYTRSFFPLSGFDNLSPDADLTFEPSRGIQYEVGVKADLLDGKLSATLAAYQLTKTNVLTPDPADPTRSIQTGEQRSRGVEFDIAGEILPGWRVIGSYSYTNARLTEDNTFEVGNRLPNVPENQFSLWTTYEFQKSWIKGFGVGLGLFYLGERQGDLDNSFQLKDYLRTDAALFYRRDRLRLALNFRNIFDIDTAAFALSKTFVQRTEPFTIVGSISWEF
ncbi:MAG: TonB-dependent siderophore receptor [Aphanocapsa sp. GSE-SYN-MK-11-07L]|jgi:iron complex outermembrane receptor protein|nr:TonB-dependent siderophore receptor [Aphanocapsa sp. GSE-SYN-MK-11-07L]